MSIATEYSDLEYQENLKLRRLFFIIGGLFLLIMTLIFIFTPLDIIIVDFFYDESLGGFFVSDEQPWKFLYEQEGLIVGTLGAVSLIMILTSWITKDPELKKIGRYGWFILMVALMGTGLLVNAMFKGYWGRPRPREYVEFGGTRQFYPVWYPAFLKLLPSASDPHDVLNNSSFAAGHPTEFIAYIALFFVFNHPEVFVKFLGEFKTWKLKMLMVFKYLAPCLSLVGGFLMAMGRAVQGGHWPSDSMWSFGFVYITAAILYYWVFNFPKWEKANMQKWQDSEYEIPKKQPIWAGLSIFLCICGVFMSIVWYIEYSIRPDAFLIELIAGICIDIASPIICYFAIRDLKSARSTQ